MPRSRWASCPSAIPEQTYGANDDGLMPWIEEAVERRAPSRPCPDTAESPPSRRSPQPGRTSSWPPTPASPRPTTTSSPRSRRPSPTPTSRGRRRGATSSPPSARRWASRRPPSGARGHRPEVAAAAAAHPEFEGVTDRRRRDRPGAFYVYTPPTRGCSSSRTSASGGPERRGARHRARPAFYYALSTEEVDELTTDVLLTYSNDQERRTDAARPGPPGDAAVPGQHGGQGRRGVLHLLGVTPHRAVAGLGPRHLRRVPRGRRRSGEVFFFDAQKANWRTSGGGSRK